MIITELETLLKERNEINSDIAKVNNCKYIAACRPNPYETTKDSIGKFDKNNLMHNRINRETKATIIKILKTRLDEIDSILSSLGVSCEKKEN